LEWLRSKISEIERQKNPDLELLVLNKKKEYQKLLRLKQVDD
jgi:hypothetical protein